MLREVSLEVQYQIARLNTHASIVVWGGNNENEVALNWFPESYTNR
jgi:beta-mannosidase